ncbi:Probable decaprenylphosphoryl-beta-D-ribose oxidase [Delftia tsuruhatensis]|uniref:FAD-binding oxidoreductase n=1 Tax=Delftia tsuruhatensis TaxID=180282 RepID=UPI001E80B9F8|nr:FAD-binding oxidoreductase [Delftia tsuruhatensis]CAB5701131.1 Probable decaprenylphosphoryl-beta-D-ribose oxidase [Delftia tsuruhatensis]CAC9693395.1 Probable decaprenylphosphoryl-beta-D-ribose oxidase [Delftia tsuruhatensis]
MRAVSSWGRLSALPHHVVELQNAAGVGDVLLNSLHPGLAHGMGRSYGDVCLNPGRTLWSTLKLDHFIAFDRENGRLTCEAGVLLRDIQNLVVPCGWMLAVSPGTQMVTVGGAIANDVHGKNHHAHGSFGDHVLGLTLFRTNGEVIHCGPHERSPWFEATVGGLGLTGVIARVEIQLRRISGPWINAETVPYASLDEFLLISDGSESDWENTVSWIDCLSGTQGRGIFVRGNFAEENLQKRHPHQGRQIQVPVTPPFSMVNGFSLKLFNNAYYFLNKKRAGRSLIHYVPFLYPLDNLLEWNRIYGPKGFYQYQSVIPRDVAHDAVKAMLNEIAKDESGSFLAVLKTFGRRKSVGMLSFPREGVTLALDFPDRGRRTSELFQRLDAIVREAGGAIYLAKDARVPRDLFESGYPRLGEFLKYRDPGISSGLSQRLMGG